MDNMTIQCYSTKFLVDTFHEEYLEFVLNDAEERNGKSHAYYSDALVNMIDKELKSKTFPSATLDEKSVYGYVGITVTADTSREMDEALIVCGDVIERWKTKFKIDLMKNSQNLKNQVDLIKEEGSKPKSHKLKP